MHRLSILLILNISSGLLLLNVVLVSGHLLIYLLVLLLQVVSIHTSMAYLSFSEIFLTTVRVEIDDGETNNPPSHKSKVSSSGTPEIIVIVSLHGTSIEEQAD